MNRKDYETEFERLTNENVLVRAALLLHEQDRSRVELTLAMKIMVVGLAQRNAELMAELAELRSQPTPTVIRLCDHEACPNKPETTTP
jgi:lysine/ornithine N-monooxygenase